MVDTLQKQREQLRNDLRRQLRLHRDSLSVAQLEQAESDLLAQLQACWTSLTATQSKTLSPTARTAGATTTTTATATTTATTAPSAEADHHARPLNIAGYLATGGEISLASSLQWLRQLGHKTFLPIVKQKQLMFAKLDKDTRFTTGKYNIDIPVYCEDTLIPATKLDVVLLPLLGFDLQGGRLGMGGGYYDRTFEFLLKNERQLSGQKTEAVPTQPLMIGIAHEFQRQQKIPVETWDVPIAAAITDRANYYVANVSPLD